MRFLAARGQLYLVAVTLSLAVALSACSPRVVLKSIPAEVIPEELKNGVQAMGSKERPVSKVVWRVYEIKDGCLLAACTFAQEWEPGVKVDMFWVWSAELDESGNMAGRGGGGGGGFDSSRSFYGMHGSRGGLSGIGEPVHSLWALGYCFDGRVEAIQGTTSDGQTATTKPSGGFWYLWLDNTSLAERWTRVSGIDKSGRPVVDLTISP